jgi:hypothetical protein
VRQAREEAGESERTPGQEAVAAAASPVSAALLGLQQGYGNAVVARILQRKPKAPPPPDALIRGLGSAAVADSESAALYDSPDPDAKPAGELAAGKSVKLIASTGDFYAVEIDGRKQYVRATDVATAIDTPGEQTKADWDQRLRAMAKKMDDAGHKQGAALRGGGGTAKIDTGSGAFSAEFMKLQHKLSMTEVWDEVEEEAQHLLRDYALWYMESYHGGSTLPGNLRVMFDYIGRSTKNTAAAEKGGYKGAKHFGGYLMADKTPSKNWCTQTSSTAVLDAIAASGKKVSEATLKKQLPHAQAVIYGDAAYAAPLLPGDMVFYLFQGCQYGGHAVTVIDDLGDSFTHISGNTGDAISVGIGEAKRMKTPPSGFVLGKATPAPVVAAADALAEEKEAAAKKTSEKQTAATRYIAGFTWGDGHLVYSITRYGSLLNALEAPKPKTP